MSQLASASRDLTKTTHRHNTHIILPRENAIVFENGLRNLIMSMGQSHDEERVTLKPHTQTTMR